MSESRSWGHALLTERTVANYLRCDAEGHPAYERQTPATCKLSCSALSHTAKMPAVAWATYRYVTGRAGRVTDRDVPVCSEHAQKFANRHGIQWGAA